MKKTAVLLIGFGGPRNMDEVEPFLQSVVGGTKIPRARVREVHRHYELIGGKSRFNEVTELQRKGLEKELHARGLDFAVLAAYRHSTPTFEDAFKRFERLGVERVIGLILTSFQSFAGRGKYVEKVQEGKTRAHADGIEVLYTAPFDLDPLFLAAQSDRAREAWGGPCDGTVALFTAHSIPSAMCEESAPQNGGRCYGFQFHRASERIAARLGIGRWRACYQSRSGNPQDRWLEPDVREVIASLDAGPVEGVLLVPVGFLCDNMEIVYDLDVEAKQAARARGLGFRRAGTVGDHPKFIKMMAEKVLERAS